jgi:pyruvate dehydrogenase E1 component alpha subunit
MTQQLNLSFYKDMLLIRRFEERAGQLYGMGLIGGFCHLYIGQEAVVVGMQSVSQNQDTVITSYRDHGHMLACGMSARGVMAELTGRKDGYSKGKGGSMHMFSREKKFFGGHGIVGAQVSIGTGMALAHQYKQDKGVCLTYMGDGAMNQGQVYESFNMAALWKLPVLYIVENNQYSMGTSVERSAAGPGFYARGTGYDIGGEQVDGMDLTAIQDAGAKALDYVRSGKGPYILEMMTYRYRGHSMSDPAQYRTKDEVTEQKTRDPLTLYKDQLLDNDIATEADFKAMEQDVKDVVMDAITFAQDNPEPDLSELYTDVLIDTKS